METAFVTLSQTQRALLDALRRKHVRSIVIGGYAVRFHGCLRATADLDLVVDCDNQNLIGVRNTLMMLGARELDHVVQHLSGGPRQRVKWHDVDLFSSVEDWSYDRLSANAVGARIGDSDVLVMSRHDLIETKHLATRNAGRRQKMEQDLDDLRCLCDAGNDPV
jgi:hypothetical protein